MAQPTNTVSLGSAQDRNCKACRKRLHEALSDSIPSVMQNTRQISVLEKRANWMGAILNEYGESARAVAPCELQGMARCTFDPFAEEQAFTWLTPP